MWKVVCFLSETLNLVFRKLNLLHRTDVRRSFIIRDIISLINKLHVPGNLRIVFYRFYKSKKSERVKVIIIERRRETNGKKASNDL